MSSEHKQAPMSRGLVLRRRKMPTAVAFVTDGCTGCGGAGACVESCPVAECLYWSEEASAMRVDAELCIGCRRCALRGCPFAAIEMRPLTGGRVR